MSSQEHRSDGGTNRFLDADDPRVTAYALGELEGAERAEVEAALATNDDARRAVEEIRGTAAALRTDLLAEEGPALAPIQKRAIDARLAADASRRRLWLRSMRVRAMFLAAAAVLLAVGIATVTMHTRMDARTPRLAQGSTELARGGGGSNIGTTFELKNGKTISSSETTPIRPGTTVDLSTLTIEPGSSNFPNNPDLNSGIVAPIVPQSGTAPYGGIYPPNGKPQANPGIRTETSGEGEKEYFVRYPDGRVEKRSETMTATPKLRLVEMFKKPKGPASPSPGVLDLDGFGQSTGSPLADDPRQVAGAAKPREPQESPGTESYDRIPENPFKLVADDPLSTFSVDVDTASYTNLRRFLNQGQLPPKDAVRIEELINYFTYSDPAPTSGAPVAVRVEVASCPWKSEHRLVRIGLKAKEIAFNERKPTNLVFLIDVSGSMQPANKLPLLKRSMRLLVDQLGENDRVALVVYAGNTGLVLPSTSCVDKPKILDAIDRLEAGGSTNGAAGIQLAYDTAVANFLPRGNNRVILATDGDFNVGITDQGSLTRLIEEKAKSGVFLSVLGYGMGNLKDATLEKLADKGNGNYAYVDDLQEARRVLVEQMGATLETVAKDVKLQIEFNPATVSAYRLVGYENRILAHQDFNDDKKDAGDMGAGHCVTALYEIAPVGTSVGAGTIDPLKYQRPKSAASVATAAGSSDELLTVKVRYKEPSADKSQLLEFPARDSFARYGQASDDFKFAAAVAAFGMTLRDSEHRGTASLDAVLELAGESLGQDRGGYRRELLDLVKRAKQLGVK